jgi:hypothetical protein
MSAEDAKRDAKNLANDAESQAKKGKKKAKNTWSDIPEDYKASRLVHRAASICGTQGITVKTCFSRASH